jgi:hypothetical protein
MPKLRVGYILDDGEQSSDVHYLIAQSKRAGSYSIELLILQKTFQNSPQSFLARVIDRLKRRGIKQLIQRVGLRLIERAEKLLVCRNPEYVSFFNRYSLHDIDIPKLYLEPLVSKSGFVFRYSPDDLEKIKHYQLDILVRGGSGILRGEILAVCPFGIVSFHHANNDVNRGGPPGFWEVFNREPSTGFILQRLTDELDGGDVLLKGSRPTSSYYMLNVVRLSLKANIFLHRFLERLGESRALPEIFKKVPYSYPLYRNPLVKDQLRYVWKTFVHLGRKKVRAILGKTHRWGVAYQFVKDWRSSVLWRSTVIKNPPNRFLADPFVIYKDGSHICFVEDYDYAKGKGKISAYEITRDKYRELGTAIEESFHLSYPFLFEDAGQLFMCPETAEAGDIRIYKCVDFPLKWQLHRVLKSGVNAVDTSIFKYGEKWWMLTNIDSSASGDNGSELHVFYADTYDTHDWKAHPLNPVLFDSQRARNGGLLLDGSDIYRIFQVHGFDLYGESMGIARITELTTETYSEEVECQIPAKFMGQLKGTHTFSYNAGLLAIDLVRVERRKTHFLK